MSFWKKVGNALGQAVSSAGKLVTSVGGAVAKVSEFVGADQGETVGGWLKKGGETLTSWGETIKKTTSDTAKTLGRQGSYSGSDSSLGDTVDVNKALIELNRRLEPHLESVELGAVNVLQDYFFRVKQAFVNLTDKDLQLDFDIERLNRNAENAILGIKGKVNQHVAVRAALSDKECADILGMKPGSNKQERTERFIRSILNEGLETLASDIRFVAEQQQSEIEELLENKLVDMLRRQEIQIQQLQEIERAAHEGNTELQLKKERVKNTLKYCDFAIKELQIHTA